MCFDLARAHRDPVWFRAATRKRPCFAAECGPTPLGTYEHSSAHFSILRLRTPKQGVPKGLEQPHEKKGGDLEIGTWPRLKCSSHTKRTALFCCRMWLGPPWAHRDPGWFRAATRKERPCFAAECGPDPFWHTRALEGPFFDPKTQSEPSLEQPNEKNGPVDEKNGPVLLQSVASAALGIQGPWKL